MSIKIYKQNTAAHNLVDIMCPMDDIKFTEWLESQMKIYGYNQSQLAKRAGITRSAINKILIQDRKPGPEVCTGIARAFNYPPEDIFRIAGLLPPKPERNLKDEKILYMISQVDEDTKDDLVDYIEYFVNKNKN